MKNNKTLEAILKERKVLLDTKTLLIRENHSIIAEGRCIRKALSHSIRESGRHRHLIH